MRNLQRLIGTSQAANGQFLHYGWLVFLGGAEELFEGADELGLKVDELSGVVLAGGGYESPEVPRVLGEHVEGVLFGGIGKMDGAFAGDAV